MKKKTLIVFCAVLIMILAGCPGPGSSGFDNPENPGSPENPNNPSNPIIPTIYAKELLGE